MIDLNTIIQDLSTYYADVGVWYETYSYAIQYYLTNETKSAIIIDALIKFSETHEDLSEYLWVACKMQRYCYYKERLPESVYYRVLALTYTPDIKLKQLSDAIDMLFSQHIQSIRDLYYKIFSEFDIYKYRYLVKLHSMGLPTDSSQIVWVFRALTHTYNKELVDE